MGIIPLFSESKMSFQMKILYLFDKKVIISKKFKVKFLMLEFILKTNLYLIYRYMVEEKEAKQYDCLYYYLMVKITLSFIIL